MRKWISIVAAFTLASGFLSGCSGADAGNDAETETSGSVAESKETSGETDGGEVAESKEDTADAGDETEAAAESDADMFTNRDCRTEYDESACVSIQLNGDSVSADSDSVNISGTTVTITEEAQAQAAVQMQQKWQLQKIAGSLPQRRRLRETAGRIFRRL